MANAAEGEPGTFKDRRLMRDNPYQLIEGVAIAAFAIGATDAFIGLKASFTIEIERLERALAEMTDAGLAGDVRIQFVPGPEEYLLGEEKALLEVIEGKDPLPRLLPPYLHGLFSTAPQMGWISAPLEAGHRGPHESNPTLVNNAETLSNVPWILARGPQWFRTMGTPSSPGTVVATVGRRRGPARSSPRSRWAPASPPSSPGRPAARSPAGPGRPSSPAWPTR